MSNRSTNTSAGTLLYIPYHVEMNVRNEDEDLPELLVIKAPRPSITRNTMRQSLY